MKKSLIFGTIAAVAGAGAIYLIRRYRNGKSLNGSEMPAHRDNRHKTDVFSRAKQTQGFSA